MIQMNMYVRFDGLTEAISTWSQKGDFPRTGATGLHPITEGEIQEWRMPEESQRMGSGIQLQSAEVDNIF